MKQVTTIALILFSVLTWAQEKTKVRVSVGYQKIEGLESYIRISAKFKGLERIEPAEDVEFNVYQILKDSLRMLGKARTGGNGLAKFGLDSLELSSVDSGVLRFRIAIENNARFLDAEWDLHINEAHLSARIDTVENEHFILATLTDLNGRPLPNQPLRIQLQRMYAPLLIGEESYNTDESGSIRVLIEDRMPGVDGILTFEVLHESEDFGTIKALVTAPIGTPIVDQSTFDQRTMWGPRSKTPLYLLLFPNAIILGVWIPLIALLLNLYRISKAK